MGFRCSILLLLPALLAGPALARQDSGASPIFNLPGASKSPPDDRRRQGPELDVYRAPATVPVPVPVPPPVALPTLPPAAAATAPAPVPPPPEQRTSRTAAPAAPAKEEPTASRPRADRAAASAASQAPAPAPQPSPPAIAAHPAIPPAASPAPQPPSETAPSRAMPWGRIAAALVALLALIAAALLLRRRRRGEPAMVADAETPPPVPLSPAEDMPAQTAAPRGERPRLDCSLEVTAARYSLMGATISYRLAVQNRGEQAADDILIRVLLANAGTAQQDMLDHFLDGSLGLASHFITALAPGEGQWLSGELRLPPEDIVPLHAGERALLVPLALFDLHYPLPDGTQGRLARSFLIGQAPALAGDRLAPLRMDMGPRQFRNPAARAVGDILTR